MDLGMQAIYTSVTAYAHVDAVDAPTAQGARNDSMQSRKCAALATPKPSVGWTGWAWQYYTCMCGEQVHEYNRGKKGTDP